MLMWAVCRLLCRYILGAWHLSLKIFEGMDRNVWQPVLMPRLIFLLRLWNWKANKYQIPNSSRIATNRVFRQKFRLLWAINEPMIWKFQMYGWKGHIEKKNIFFIVFRWTNNQTTQSVWKLCPFFILHPESPLQRSPGNKFLKYLVLFISSIIQPKI